MNDVDELDNEGIDYNDNTLGDNEDNAIADEGMVTVVIGRGKDRRKIKRVTRCMLHPLISSDVFTVGREKMRQKDLPALQLRRRKRQQREQKALHDNLYVFLQGLGNDFNDVLTKLDSGLLLPAKQRHTIAAQFNMFL